MNTELNFPNPVEHRSDLFHRSRELQQIIQAICSPDPHPVIVQGERLMGKTSILNVICEWAELKEIRVVHLPRVATRQEFTVEVMDGIALATGKRPRGADTNGTVPIYDFTSELDFLNAAGKLTEPDTAYLVCLDELDSMIRRCADVVAAKHLLDAAQVLANCAQLPIRFLCTTTRTISQTIGVDPSHFMHRAHVINLHPWTSDESRTVVEALLDLPTLDEQLTAALFQYCGGHPYLTKAFLLTLQQMEQTALPIEARFEPHLLQEAAVTTVNSTEVDFALHNIVNVHFTDRERALLYQAARSSSRTIMLNTSTRTSDSDTAERSPVQSLADRGYLNVAKHIKSSAHTYDLAYGLLGYWLRENSALDPEA